MKIVVPFVDGYEYGHVELLHDRGDLMFVDVSGSDEAYWSLLSRLWREQETFMLVEHDIVPHGDVVEQFEECPNGYCAFGYPYLHMPEYHGLGCSRFRGSMMKLLPDAMDTVATLSNDKHPPKHWCALDAWIQRVLGWQGYTQCQHGPPVGHVGNNWPSHGCWGNPPGVAS